MAKTTKTAIAQATIALYTKERVNEIADGLTATITEWLAANAPELSLADSGVDADGFKSGSFDFTVTLQNDALADLMSKALRKAENAAYKEYAAEVEAANAGGDEDEESLVSQLQGFNPKNSKSVTEAIAFVKDNLGDLKAEVKELLEDSKAALALLTKISKAANAAAAKAALAELLESLTAATEDADEAEEEEEEEGEEEEADDEEEEEEADDEGEESDDEGDDEEAMYEAIVAKFKPVYKFASVDGLKSFAGWTDDDSAEATSKANKFSAAVTKYLGKELAEAAYEKGVYVEAFLTKLGFEAEVTPAKLKTVKALLKKFPAAK